MYKLPKYDWNEKDGIATCTLYYNNLKFVGEAKCHKDDEDMKSKLIGLTIAEWRALLLYYRHIRDNEIKPKLKALKQLYYNINLSKRHDPKSYETKMIYRHINNANKELEEIRQTISDISLALRNYIEFKENSHSAIRKHNS